MSRLCLILAFVLACLPSWSAQVRVATNITHLLSFQPSPVEAWTDVDGFSFPGDWGVSKRFRWDPTNSLPTNATRFMAPGKDTGRYVYSGQIDAGLFGARGDGVTDDTAALQAAFDYSTNGVKLFVPRGNYIITTNLVLYSNALIEFDTEAWVVGGFTTFKPKGYIYSYGSDLPEWSEPMVIATTNITLINVGVRTAPGSSNNAPLIFIDSTENTHLTGTRLYGRDHEDWGLTLCGNNITSFGHDIDTRGVRYQDGVHIFRGSNIVVRGGTIKSGDDVFGIGTFRDQSLRNVSVGDVVFESTDGHCCRVESTTNTIAWTGQISSNKVEDVLFSNMTGLAGLEENGQIYVDERTAKLPALGSTNQPLRMIKNITFKNIFVSSEGDTNKPGAAYGIYVSGGENITFDNGSTRGSPRSTFYVEYGKNIKVKNWTFGPPEIPSASFPTVRISDSFSGAQPYNTHENITFEDCVIEAPWEGTTNVVNTVVVKNTTGIRFINNQLYCTNWGALNFSDSNSVIEIRNNTFTRFGTNGTTGAISYSSPNNNLIDAGNNNFIPDSPTFLKHYSVVTNLYLVNAIISEGSQRETYGNAAGDGLHVYRSGIHNTILELRDTTFADPAVQDYLRFFRGNNLRLYMMNGDGHITGQQTTSDLTTKQWGFGVSHYTNTANGLRFIAGQTAGSANFVEVGGGSSSFNSATSTRFWAAPNTFTPTGTNVATVTFPSGYGTPLNLMVPNLSTTNLQLVNVDSNYNYLYVGSTHPLLRLDAPIEFGTKLAANPSDSATNYVLDFYTLTASSGRYATIRRTGTIKAVDVYFSCAAVGSSEVVTNDLVISGGSSIALTDITCDALWQKFSTTGLSNSVTSGDGINLRLLTPEWATNPTNTYWQVRVWMQ